MEQKKYLSKPTNWGWIFRYALLMFIICSIGFLILIGQEPRYIEKDKIVILKDAILFGALNVLCWVFIIPFFHWLSWRTLRTPGSPTKTDAPTSKKVKGIIWESPDEKMAVVKLTNDKYLFVMSKEKE